MVVSNWLYVRFVKHNTVNTVLQFSTQLDKEYCKLYVILQAFIKYNKIIESIKVAQIDSSHSIYVI
jgi:hypothetical protein